jgi:hypothetical protein
MRRWLLFLALCFLPSLAWATPERPGIGVEVDYPIQGQPVQIYISHATAKLEQFQFSVTYRPNSMVSHKEELGHPNDNGYLTWTPKDTGVTILQASIPGSTDKTANVSKQISVRYAGIPLLGILIFLLASITLFGGFAWTLSHSKKA